MFGIGGWELVVIIAVALLVLGPRRLPAAARAIGKGLQTLRRATIDLRRSIELDPDMEDLPRSLDEISRPIIASGPLSPAARGRPRPDQDFPVPKPPPPTTPLEETPAPASEDGPGVEAPWSEKTDVRPEKARPAPLGGEAQEAGPGDGEGRGSGERGGSGEPSSQPDAGDSHGQGHDEERP